MAIPKLTEESIKQAIDYIDEHGVPVQNQSTVYELVIGGKKYPPKYVIGVANHLANGGEVNTQGYNAVEAKNYFESRGFQIEMKQEKYELTITADGVVSTDDRFTMDNLSAGDNFKPIDVYFQNAAGENVYRNRNKSENKISNQTLARLAFQIFEKEISSLSDEDKLQFPICQYSPSREVIRGIFPSEAEFKKHRNSVEISVYKRENGPQFVIYSWNVFSTIIFARECLQRFGKPGDKFVLVYRDKTEQELNMTKTEKAVDDDLSKTTAESKNQYSKVLLQSKNIIFRGAPGTGKSYLAKSIAADIISNGYTDSYADLTAEQKKQVEFVQFHPSYDYSDFVEGLRPKMNEDGTMAFELQDGIFKRFVERARKNFEESQMFAQNSSQANVEPVELKKYIFIIDEINRGEISKILGELFFSIDPGYRGKAGEVSTQYANMHENPDEKFYIPENVYVIGTMNDIDRSVDSFDFAMRRRFRFVEIKADSTQYMLEALEDETLKNEAVARMDKLNAEILETPDLNENYQVGAAYFLKLKTLSFDELWTDCLKPLLQDYVRGMYDEDGIMKRFAQAYGYVDKVDGVLNETAENQGQ